MNMLTRLLLLCALIVMGTTQAEPAFTPTKPDIQAKGYLLQDYHSGYVLAESNADERLEPASLTKMMTAYVISAELASGRLRLDDQVRISEKAWRQEGSRTFLLVNTAVTLEVLLRGLIIQSGNDAAVALAEHLSGSEEAFAVLMNRHAERLGMQHTHFVNSTGLPHANHYTTARDMARLAVALIRDYPDHYSWYSEKEFHYNKIKQPNRNLLLWRDPSVDGIKTGHTESAGFCLVASAKRDNMRLVSVVMGTKSEEGRAKESQKLLDFGFGFYETHRLFAESQPLKSLRIWKGESEELTVGLDRPLYVTIPRGSYGELNASLSVAKTIIAPAQKGQNFGALVVRLGELPLANQPLVALQTIPEGGIVTRLMDDVRLWFN